MFEVIVLVGLTWRFSQLRCDVCGFFATFNCVLNSGLECQSSCYTIEHEHEHESDGTMYRMHCNAQIVFLNTPEKNGTTTLTKHKQEIQNMTIHFTIGSCSENHSTESVCCSKGIINCVLE